MKIPNYRGSKGVTINLTPMIDVTFLLIIFFLVSSHLATQEIFLKLDLPVAAAGSTDFSDRPTVTVQVLGTGEYQISGQVMTLDQVSKTLLNRANIEREPIRVRIRTDRGADYKYIAALLKTCSVTGNSDVIFAVYEE